MKTRASVNARGRAILTSLAFVLAIGIGSARTAYAGPVEVFTQLALHPNIPDVMVMRYHNGGDGVFYTRDGGKNWSLMCATAIDASMTGSLNVGVAGDGTAMFTGDLGGLVPTKTVWEDDGHGCAFTRIGSLASTWISDIQPDPTDPDVMFAVSSGLDMQRLNGLWKRKADGQWSQVGPRERMMISRLRITTTENGLRMYASALREVPAADAGSTGATLEYRFVIRMSDDGGETWDEHEFPHAIKGGSVRLDAIDPSNPDAIVVVVTVADAMGVSWEGSKDYLFVSDDRGATFHEYLTMAESGGAVFDAEGRLWIGDGGNINDRQAPQGLWMATSLAEPPTKVSDDVIQCLAFQPATDTLYACQRISVASVDRESGKLTQVVRAVTATAFTACDGADMAAACEMQLCGAYCGLGHFAQAPLCKAYDTPTCGPAAAALDGMLDAGTSASDGGASGSGAPARDAATSDAEVDDAAAHRDAGNVHLTGTGSDCGCTVVGARASSGPRLGLAWLFAALLFAARRAPRTRPRAHERC